ncbi:MAG: D-erythronate dehydrogenase [Pseudomonadota bacterium]
MKVLVIGAAGMIGRKLVERLAADKAVNGVAITSIHAFDMVEPDFSGLASDISIECSHGDISQAETAPELVRSKPDLIFHLAAIVSGEAEVEFDKGYAINMDGVRYLLEAVREAGHCPRLVFASSIAVYGAPFDERIADDFHLTPRTSYGTQKAIGELLLADYTRKGFVDGIGLRLPTIVVRPGKPNLAASGFFSNIIREPLAGERAVLPVSRDVKHWAASPRAAVGFCLHAASIDGEFVGPNRSLTMPGVRVTVGAMIDALEEVAGPETVALIDEVPDEAIISIVDNWPRSFEANRAVDLGFQVEKNFTEIIRVHQEDELS